MPVICPRCQQPRAENTPAPDWQCPACGVAYAKAMRLPHEQALPPPLPRRTAPASGPGGSQGPWIVLAILFLAVLYIGSQPGGGPRPEVQAVAESVQQGDILMYGFESCPACRQARRWMDRNGFPYEICDIHRSPECARQLQAYGENAVPYFVVRGERRLGFNEDWLMESLATR